MKKNIALILCLVLTLTLSNFQSTFASQESSLKKENITLDFRTKAEFRDWGKWSEGLMWVKGDNTALYIDKYGKTAIDVKAAHEKLIVKDLGQASFNEYFPSGINTESLYIEDFSENLGFTSFDGEESVYFDKDGNVVFEKFNFGNSFNEGVAFLNTPEYLTSFIMDKKGNIASTKDKGLFGVYWNQLNEGLFIYESFEKPGIVGFKDVKMNTVIEAKFQDARPFNQGLAFVKNNGKWGVINEKGAYVIEPQFDDFKVEFKNYTVFHNDIAAVMKNGRWGYINKTGKTIIDFKYNDADIFHEGLASVKLEDKWGVINTSGNIVSDFYWDSISQFLNGIAYGKIDGKYGYINPLGELIIPNKFSDANYFSNGVALVKYDGLYRLIDIQGNFVSDEKWYFQASKVDRNNPEIIMYKYNDKWGLARISRNGIKGIPVELKPKAYSNSSTLTFTKYEEYEGSNGIFYTITNNSNTVDDGQKCIFINGPYPELHIIEYENLKPGESITGDFHTKISAKNYLENNDHHIIDFSDSLKYDIFLDSINYQEIKSNPFSNIDAPDYIIDDSPKGREWIEKYFGVKRTRAEGKYPSN